MRLWYNDLTCFLEHDTLTCFEFTRNFFLCNSIIDLQANETVNDYNVLLFNLTRVRIINFINYFIPSLIIIQYRASTIDIEDKIFSLKDTSMHNFSLFFHFLLLFRAMANK